MADGERLEEIVEAAVARGDAPGVVAAVGRGDEAYVTAAGVMAVGGPPMRADTLFRIASVTKPVTAAVVLGLAEDGLLGLDEPVDRLLPELAGRRVLRRPDGPLTDTVEAERAVTARDLLTFTWGFGMQGAMFMAAEPWPPRRGRRAGVHGGRPGRVRPDAAARG
jgi:CubicO group peptidase (beta-lactamase class C family)